MLFHLIRGVPLIWGIQDASFSEFHLGDVKRSYRHGSSFGFVLGLVEFRAYVERLRTGFRSGRVLGSIRSVLAVDFLFLSTLKFMIGVLVFWLSGRYFHHTHLS